jgi:putative acetyltransferase
MHFVEVINTYNQMNLNNIQIRETITSDFNYIMEVETLAFGYDKEAKLVADLLADNTARPIVSLLAYHKDEPVGHILFTRAYFSEQEEQPMMHILAPLAVKPEYQRQGIGGMLITAGIEKLRKKGSNLVFVLGHKEYYPKYGFIPDANRLGYPAPYPMPEEYSDYWMVQPVSQKGFEVGKGKIACCDELNKPKHWRDEESDR